MIKPIVPGCLALLRPTEFKSSGKTPAQTVVVIKLHNHGGEYFCGECGSDSNHWIVDSSVLSKTVCVCGCGLTRIDGHDPDAEITENEKEKGHAYTC